MANYWLLSKIRISLFFVYFALATSSLSLNQHITCNEDELSALVNFKQSFSINVSASGSMYAYPKLISWKLNESNCCSWKGVECSADTGHVVGLDLGSCFIHGPLNSNSSLFNLADNDFTQSQIPSKIGILSQLRSLNLSFSAFSGQIPKEISHLTHLVSLDLSGNPLLKLQNPSFKHLVQNLTELEELSLFLGQCGLYGSVPATFNNLTKLTRLSLGYNLFTGHIPNLESLSEMTHLSLSHNGFLIWQPNWLGKLSKIELLDLESTNLYGSFPSSLSNLTQLTTMLLGQNHIYDHIPSWLMNLTQLSTIDFMGNQLQGTIPPSFSQLKNLTFLSLVNNNFSGTVATDIFLNLNKLYALQLGGNRIRLTDNNNFTNVTVPQLEILGLQSCNLKVFPDFLRTQNQLSVLFMDQNHVEGQIPEWFLNKTKDTLECFSVPDNLITSFENHPHVLPWVSVRILDFSYNIFQGSLPIPPPSTNVYHLRNNRFTGDISLLICQVSSLQELDLSYNNLTGIIPPCLDKFSNSLSVLVLKGNNLVGTIPNTFMEGSQLKIIDLSENQLEGKLPGSLTNCTLLIFLDLAENSFEDVFPTWLGTHPNLQVLILRSNQFNGELRSSRESKPPQYTTLRIVDLSNNAFTGNLPREYIESWNSMKTVYSHATYLDADDVMHGNNIWNEYFVFTMTITNKGVKREYERVLNLFTVIDLSSNKFIGEIPESLGQLQDLQLLNLSNNYLSGCIPNSFHNLTNLECLDLSQNRLSGEIPQQLAQLTSLEILNVSDNHLLGPIPLGKQFNTFQSNSFEGNPGLCGEPLSKKCGNIQGTQVPVINERGDDDSEFPSGVDWIVISLGLGSGLVVGLIFGKYLGAKHHEWFVEKFGKNQDKWVRPLRRRRRN